MSKYALPPIAKPNLPMPQSVPNHQSVGDEKMSSVMSTEKSLTASKILARKRSAAAMNLATSPGKSILMTGFMLWMSGRHLNVFTISTTSMALINPIKGVLGTNANFKRFESPPDAPPGARTNLLQAKAIYVALNLVALAVGMYKMNSMGLLPMTTADWTNLIDQRGPEEINLMAV
ncbi:hypothetical protein TrRE_jg5304 [Triparma retinervis]|uniref:ER membrane protein complex subunit 4 n=1 Tax=Triparma retinervis TaxID=2557542 RepID=A0A9W7C5Z8_9STRA|nr:hypothetical protein TrRE_jg5304 [Triparma retinervis]